MLDGHARQGRRGQEEPAGRHARRLPARREDRRDARPAASDGDSIAALAMVIIDNPMLPGTGHRICNDCMKACIFQKQEPVNIPQAETGVLTDVLGMRWGFEIYGLLTRWNPLNRARPLARPYIGKNVLVVGLGPAGLHAVAPPAQRGLRRRRHRRAEDRAAARGSDRRGRLAAARRRALGGADDAARPAAAGRLRRRRRVRHHRPLGQELPDRAAPDAGAARRLPRLRRRALRRHPRRRRGVRDRLRPRRHRGGRGQADDHRRQEQPDPRRAQGVRLPDGAAADGRVQARFARQPAGAAAGDRHRRRADRHRHHDRGGRVLPGAGREVPRALGDAGRRSRARTALFAELRRRGGGDRARVPGPRARGARRARARGGGRRERPTSASWSRRGAACRWSTARAWRTARPTGSTTRRSPSSSRRACASSRSCRRWPASPTSAARWRASSSKTAAGRAARSTLPARTLFVAAGTAPNVTYERERPGSFEIDPRTKGFRAFQRRARRRRRPAAGAGDRRQVGFFTCYLRRRPHGHVTTATTTPATRGRWCGRWPRPRTARRTSRRCSRADIAALDPAEQPARDAAWRALTAQLDDDCAPTVAWVDRLTPTIVEVVVRAPAAARHFEPGQFFRLQNYEALSRAVERHPPDDGRPGADRRVGRQGARACCR